MMELFGWQISEKIFPYKKATSKKEQQLFLGFKATGGLESSDGFHLARPESPGMQKSNDTNISSIWGGRERF